MTDASIAHIEHVLVAIDITKTRHEVLLSVPGVIVPKNEWVENWTSPAFDALGERHEEITIYGKPDPGDFKAMMRIRK
ncbi:MAG: hypothetical protein RIE06_33590 [Roseibium album]|uniref:hypothetical protein n=1 Tax=Roseibium album TaxID=311410 RepID=UPI0032EE026B